MKKFVNFRFIVTLVLAVFANVVTYAQDNVIDEVVWVVGDEAILKSDVEEARMDALYNGRRFEGDPYCVIPEEIAVQKLFLHQAKLDSIEVSEAEIIQRVDMMTNMYIQQIGSKEKMEEYFNKTATQIRETLRENARDGLTVQKMQQKLVGEIKVTPAEVRRYFKDLPQDSIPYIPTQVEVQIITLQPKIPIAEIEDVKRRLRDYTDRVTKGEIDFSTLARLYSEDKASAIKGGELDFMGRGMLDPAYANVAFSLQDPKKVSKIVESEFGYHIIQLIEKRGDRVNTRHILLRPKVSEKELTEACARLDSIGDDIRQNKFTFDDAASVISQDKDTRNNHGIMVNTNERTGITTSKFQMQDLPQDVAKVVDKMNVGEISKAFTMINEKDGKEVCARVVTITIQQPKNPSQGTESFALDVNKTEIDNLVDNDHNTPADYVITASVNQMINGVANQTLSRGTELKDNTTEVKSITYKLEDKDGKDVSANTGCDITMGRNTMTVQTVSFSAFTAEKNFGAGTYKITATVKTGKKTESDSTKWVTKTFTTTFTVKDTQPTGDMSLEKDSIDRVSDSEALVKAAVKLVYGDHTYGVDDENMSIVSVEGITNTGAKLDKDNTAISSSVKSVTIKKITFTVDSGAYKVDITKDISSNPYVISFK